MEDVDAIFSGGGKIAADAGELSSAGGCSETAGDFLLNLHHTDVLFGLIV